MNKYTILFIYLISTSLCSILPLKKHNGFDDNVCAYSYQGVNYVRTCKDEGKYCKSISYSTSICEDLPTKITLKTLGEECTSKYDCEDNLFCYSGKCTMNSNSIVDCGSDSSPHKTISGWLCKPRVIENYCYYKDDNDINYSGGVPIPHDIFKVCGEISFKPISLPNNKGTFYDPIKIESTYIGTIEDGKFVKDAKACKSGFALPFYYSGGSSTLTDPSLEPLTPNQMYLKCVSVKGIEYTENGECTIKYDNDQIYNIGQIDNSIYQDFTGNSQFCKTELMTRLEMFSKYIGVFTAEKQSQCAKKENYNEKETCNENEIRKWYYYYNNPDDYILFYKEKGNDIANYLIQQSYPLYEFSKFLSVKYFICLLLLLLF